MVGTGSNAKFYHIQAFYCHVTFSHQCTNGGFYFKVFFLLPMSVFTDGSTLQDKLQSVYFKNITTQ